MEETQPNNNADKPGRTPVQFTIATLLKATAAVALFCALLSTSFNPWPVFLFDAVVLLLVIANWLKIRHLLGIAIPRLSFGDCIALLGCCVVFTSLLLPPVSSSHRARPPSQPGIAPS